MADAVAALDPIVPDEPRAFWTREIGRAEQKMSPWFQRGDKIVARYRQQALASVSDEQVRRYALLWANVETLKSAVYARSPQAVVSRRNGKQNPVARQASEALERATNYELSRSTFDDVMRKVRDANLLTARGTAWVRYEPTFEDVAVPGMPDGQTVEQLIGERCVIDYVTRRDFLHEPARTWAEVGWVARRTFYDRKAGLERFGEAFGAVGLDHAKTEAGQEKKDKPNSIEPQATVYEIWSKRDRKVFFVAKEAPGILEVSEPFLKLDGFWPCPAPAYGTLTEEDLIPTPDYVFYQGQDEEIDRLSKRIAALINGLKLVGFYPGGPDADGKAALQRMFVDNHGDNVLVPIGDWSSFQQGGGAKGLIEWWPVEQVLLVLKGCREERMALVGEVYEITGIADIMRGAVDPNEKAAQSNLKAQWGSIRIRDRQNALARFAQDICRIVAEIIAEHFQPETLAKMTEVQLSPEAAALLKDGVSRNFQISVDSDSMVQPNEDAEKQRRTEFMTMMGGFLGQAQESLAAMPPPMAAIMAPVYGESLKFAVRGFRAGRGMEDVIERSIDALVQMFQSQGQQQQEPPPPDPKLALAQQESEAKLATMQEARQQAAEKHVQSMREGSLGLELLNLKLMQASGPIMAPAEEEPVDAIVEEEPKPDVLAAIAVALNNLAAAQAAPRTVTTPDGRTFTAVSHPAAIGEA